MLQWWGKIKTMIYILSAALIGAVIIWLIYLEKIKNWIDRHVK